MQHEKKFTILVKQPIDTAEYENYFGILHNIIYHLKSISIFDNSINAEVYEIL